MKQTPKLDRIQANMQPGVLCLRGFLGSDDRKLADILAVDAEALRATGVTAAQIADRLAELTKQGRSLMEQEVALEGGRFNITVRDDRGLLPSPWGDGLFAKGDVELVETATGRRLRWNELTVQLIRAHGFFSGKGSDYRIDPTLAVEILFHPPLEKSPGSRANRSL